jgi:NTP pyrophosphatase (non-canonical NTP hydrolase)
MGKMQTRFDEVARLVEEDAKVSGANVALHMSKLMEESGEFAQEVNKNLGIKTKKSSDTPAVITDNIAQEAADMIQIIIGVCHLNGVTYDHVMDQLKKKNYVYSKFIESKRKQYET